MNVPMDGLGFRVVSDATAPDRWVSRLSWPLEKMLPGGIKAGDTFYMNAVRGAGPAITGGGMDADSWVSFSTMHDVKRLAEFRLEP